MGRTQIKGTQILDGTITGDDVNESTLILPQMYHSSADYNNTNVVYISMPGRNNWLRTFTVRQHQLIAPYNGTVTKFMIRPSVGDASDPVTVQVRTSGDGGTVENGIVTNHSMLCSKNNATVELVLATPVELTKGHAFGFSLVKNGIMYRQTNFVAVVEWDLSS